MAWYWRSSCSRQPMLRGFVVSPLSEVLMKWIGLMALVVAFVAQASRTYEPASLVLLGSGLAAVVSAARRWRPTAGA